MWWIGWCNDCSNSHGSKDANGLTIGIIPQNEPSEANEYCDVVIPTGMGLARDFLNALSADGVVIVGGGSGTLSETCASYMHKKPMVAIRNLDMVLLIHSLMVILIIEKISKLLELILLKKQSKKF